MDESFSGEGRSWLPTLLRAVVFSCGISAAFAAGIALMALPMNRLVQDVRGCRLERDTYSYGLAECRQGEDDRRSQLEHRVAACNGELEGLQFLLSERHTRVLELTERNDIQQAEIERLRTVESDLEARLQQEQQGNAALRVQLSETRDKLRAAEERGSALEVELSIAKKERDTLAAALAKANSNAESLAEENTSLRFAHEVDRAISMVCAPQGLLSVRLSGDFERCERSVRAALAPHRVAFAACPKHGDPWVKKVARGQKIPDHWVAFADGAAFALCDPALRDERRLVDQR